MPYTLGTIILDKYRIEKTLGQGAFGEVYLVTHLELNVLRAVKVLRHDAPGLGSTLYGDAQARFKLEAQLGARLNSPVANPHLLQIFDCHISEELCLLEMEYASGGSLSARLELARATNRPMPLETALQIALEVAGGLAALHANDIIHRDLKPSNILFDEHGHARLSDLGLAQVPGGPSQRSQLSDALVARHPGTEDYMSPEQESSRKKLKPPSDIYALGLVLFEMLTGRNYSFQQPGTRASSLRVEISPALDGLLAQMLAKDPEARPWNGEKAAALLQVALEEQAAQRERQAREAENLRLAEEQTRKEQAQARQIAELQTRAETAENARQAAERKAQAETEARLQAESRQSASSSPLQRQAGGGWVERYWLWLLLGGALLLGRYFIFRPSAIPTATPAPAPASTSTSAPVPTSTSRPAPSVAATDTSLPAPTAAPTLDNASPWLRPADGMTMLYVPGGKFTMGNQDFPDETPHQVTLSPYRIDQTDVTNSQYAKCVTAGGCTAPSWNTSATHSDYYVNSLYAKFPVIHVNWDQAKAYCSWAGKFSNLIIGLPSEAQWELAARGTQGRTYPWGGETIDKSYANYDGSDTTAVCSYPKGNSPYGACDMAGNVWQWVADWYEAYPISSVSNPTGPDSGQFRVLRGGSWHESNYYYFHSAGRSIDDPSSSLSSIGFRCARSN